MNDRHIPPRAAASKPIDLALPAGALLGPFEVQRLIARGVSSFVYLATDRALALPVALQEYLPERLVERDAWLHLHARDPSHEDLLSRGMRVFIEESRLMARCEHPALVRVNHLFEANGTAYRVMPFQPGKRLDQLRQTLAEPPPEEALRSLLDPLLGALESIHRLGQTHGGVSPANILLIDGDFPLLLSAGAAADEIRSDLVESLMASVESQPGSLQPDPPPTGATADLCALGEVMRFCVTGDVLTPGGAARSRDSLTTLAARHPEHATWPVYSVAFLSTVDAATSPYAEDWPTSVEQFRLWLAHGAPRARASAARRRADSAAPLQVPPALAPAATSTPNLSGVREEPVATPAPALPPRTASVPAEPYFAPIAPPLLSEPETPLAWDPPARLAEEPPVARSGGSNRRWRGLMSKLLFGGLLAGLAVAIIAWVSGAWNLMPPISLAPDVPPTVARVEVPPPTTPPPAPPIQAAPKSNESNGSAAPSAMPAETPAPSAPPRIEPEAPDPSIEPRAPTLAPGPTDEPARNLAGEGADRPPDTAPAPAIAPALKRPPPRARTARTEGPRPTGDPRAACAGRTEFALYRCMQQQCQSPRWLTHPQCLRLRLDDQIN